jgi:ABC-type transport system substrate-binding protein
VATKRRVATAMIGLAILGSCGSPVPPTSSPSAPQPAAAQPITMQVHSVPSLSNWAFPFPLLEFSQLTVPRMVHAAVYRHDASLAPVPDLAAEPCDVASDQVTITCSLREATFHDGTPVTADDVAFVYDLAKSPECGFFLLCMAELERVEAVDARTVRFTLSAPNALFLSTGLADVLVEPRAQIEAAYERFAARADAVDSDSLRELAGQIREALQAAEPDCDASLDVAEQALVDLGVELTDRALFVVFRGTAFDSCTYARYLGDTLDAAGRSLATSGVDAIAAAYPTLPFVTFNEDPVGAGPWRLRDFDPERGLVLERHEAYHHGPAVTPEIRIRVMKDGEEISRALTSGTIDWRFFPPPGARDDVRDHPSMRIAQYPAQGYLAMQFNVRPGRLFSDRSLRQAVALCIDKERTVRAANELAVAIYSPIPPGSWAHQPGLAQERDVEAGRRLIEASGWRMGDDGIYEQEGRRLSAEVVVRSEVEPPVAFLDRAAVQVRECGIELVPRLVAFPDALDMIDHFPHHVPGTDEPFDAYLGGWGLSFDPDVFDLFHSSRITNESRTGPPNFNYIGFENAEVDRLIEDALETYDLAARTELYRQLQRVLAEEQPYLFVFAITGREALDQDLTSTAGELDFASERWWWQLETLLNPAE